MKEEDYEYFWKMVNENRALVTTKQRNKPPNNIDDFCQVLAFIKANHPKGYKFEKVVTP